MGFWKAKDDLDFMRRFQSVAVGLIETLAKREEARRHCENEMYMMDAEAAQAAYKRASIEHQHYRQIVTGAEGLRADRISMKLRNTSAFPQILTNLEDPTRSQLERVMDYINQLIGSCEEQVLTERRHLLNPFYWLLSLVRLILRLPFLILKETGFNIAVLEKPFGALLIKILWLLFLLMLALRFNLPVEKLRMLFK